MARSLGVLIGYRSGALYRLKGRAATAAEGSERSVRPAATWWGSLARALVTDPSLVLISRRQIHAVDVMARQTNRWTLLYQDELAQLWGQSSKYANPESRDFLPDVERQISNAAQIGFARWPAFPNFRKTAGQLVNARGRAGSGS